MVILDPPYVSEELIGYLSRSREPVLDNETARRAANSGDFNLISPDAFRREYREGTRLYTASEFSLDWVTRNLEDPGLKDRIVKMKNKGLFRRLVACLLYTSHVFPGSSAGLRDENHHGF